MGRHPYIYACAVAAVTGLLAVIGALTLDLPFRDPDGFIGPAYIRLPVIVMFFLLLDIAPSWFREARATGAAVLVSTHLLSLAVQACEEAVVLRTGRVVGAAPASELTGSDGASRYRSLIT